MKTKQVVKILMSLLTLASLASVTTVSAEVPSRYMGGAVELATADNGAIVNAKLIEAYPKNWYTEKTVKEIVDGVWLVGEGGGMKGIVC